MSDFFIAIGDWFTKTQVIEQLQNVDVKGLFQNPYFLVPFIALIIYNLYKQAINNLGVIGIALGLWMFTGTSYVQNAVVDGEVQMGNILPLAGVGIVGIGALIYLLFMRND